MSSARPHVAVKEEEPDDATLLRSPALATNGGGPAVNARNSLDPVGSVDRVDPVDPVLQDPVNDAALQVLANDLVHQVLVNDLGHQVPANDLVHQVPVNDPVHRAPVNDPVHQVLANDPVHQVLANDLVHQVPANDLVHQVPVNGPVHRAPVNDPVHHVPVDIHQVPANIHQVPVQHAYADDIVPWAMPVNAPAPWAAHNPIDLLHRQVNGNPLHGNWMPGYHPVDPVNHHFEFLPAYDVPPVYHPIGPGDDRPDAPFPNIHRGNHPLGDRQRGRVRARLVAPNPWLVKARIAVVAVIGYLQVLLRGRRRAYTLLAKLLVGVVVAYTMPHIASMLALVVLTYALTDVRLRGRVFFHLSVFLLAFTVLYTILARLICLVSSGRPPLFRADNEPLCMLPIPPMGCLCGPSSDVNVTLGAVDMKALMKIEGDSLQALMQEHRGMASTVWDLTSADISTSHLMRLIHASSLSSKSLVVSRLQDVQQRSRTSRRALERLGGHILLCADSMLNVNDFAMRTIANDVPTLFERIIPVHPRHVRPVVREGFELSADTFTTCLGEVTLLSHDAKEELDALGISLDILDNINSLQKQALINNRDGVLALIWARLAGNRHAVRENQDNILVSALISNFCSKGTTHVNNTVTVLEGINVKIATLRDTAATTDAPYHAVQPLERELHYIGVAVNRIAEQIADDHEKVSADRKTAFARAGMVA